MFFNRFDVLMSEINFKKNKSISKEKCYFEYLNW